jgi:P-type E1-E2 ATPase
VIELIIPGRGTLQLEYLVCDVNGTLTLDGELVDGVSRLLGRLKDRLSIHLISADTLGRLEEISQRLGVSATRLKSGNEAEQKAVFVRQLNASRVVAIGQGANDSQMLKEAVVGIAVLSREGTAFSALEQADILMPDIVSALELLEKPIRIIATLRQ